MIEVIVPAYNSGDHIRKCIQSILDQKYEDFELLLIDDGSVDETPVICDEYANLDNRIRSIHKSHEGLVATRRYGLKEAKGEFVCWVDSDDWVENTFLGDFYRQQRDNDVDVVVSGLFYDIGCYSRKESGCISPGIYEVKSILDKALYAGDFYRYGIIPNLVVKFFKTEILRCAIEFVDDSITIGEDAAISYTALKFCKNIYISNTIGYHYVHHKDSMTLQKSQVEKEKIKLLTDCLKQNIGVDFPRFEASVKMYERFLMLTRTDELLKEENGRVLLPFGGFMKGENVIIYGAGGTGQTIYKFIKETGCLNIIAWVDKEYVKYKAEGISVISPCCLGRIINRGDTKIIVAVAYENVARQIINDIALQGISNDHITWLSDDFINGR